MLALQFPQKRCCWRDKGPNHISTRRHSCAGLATKNFGRQYLDASWFRLFIMVAWSSLHIYIYIFILKKTFSNKAEHIKGVFGSNRITPWVKDGRVRIFCVWRYFSCEMWNILPTEVASAWLLVLLILRQRVSWLQRTLFWDCLGCATWQHFFGALAALLRTGGAKQNPVPDPTNSPKLQGK